VVWRHNSANVRQIWRDESNRAKSTRHSARSVSCDAVIKPQKATVLLSREENTQIYQEELISTVSHKSSDAMW
jgi:hypothetical protein